MKKIMCEIGDCKQKSFATVFPEDKDYVTHVCEDHFRSIMRDWDLSKVKIIDKTDTERYSN